MKASELRIGNLVKVPQDVGYFNCKIVSLEQFVCRVNLKNEDYYLYYDEIEPRQLVEGWLIKFGFKARLVEAYKPYWVWELSASDGSVFTLLAPEGEITYESGDLTVRIEHVHRLQNLYFELKDEELTFEL